MKFKHIETCWYFNKLDHRGNPYDWPCCGEATECDENFVTALKEENARLREALQRISRFQLSQFMGPNDMALECVLVARFAIANTTDQVRFKENEND